MIKVKKQDIEAIKEEGNKAFKSENYYKAILFYEEGIRRCETYDGQWKGQLPFKCEFGDSPTLQDGAMYYQDFSRLKSILFNNISACYFNMNAMDKSDSFNDRALMEDPDFAKALYRKVLILEKNGEYTQGHHLAKFGITRFDSEYEDEENRKVVPHFVSARDRLS